MLETTPTPPDINPPTQPRKKRRFNLRAILLGFLGLILLAALGAFGGYKTASSERLAHQDTVIAQQIVDQFALAEVDISQGNYGLAKKRLEFIIQNDPSYPNAAKRLTDILILMTIPTPTVTPSPTPTLDLSGVEEIFQRAQQYINIQDWANAISNLDSLRRKDPAYRASEVDGMYLFALRNYGVDLILKQGNLEGGIYQLTLAQKFLTPLDTTAIQLMEGARAYVLAASFWDLDWKNAVTYFADVYAGWPSMWDGTMTATARYRVALMRYGDDLYTREQYCDASRQYQLSASIGAIDDVQSQKNANKSFAECFPPTEQIFPTLTEPPVATPTGP